MLPLHIRHVSVEEQAHGQRAAEGADNEMDHADSAVSTGLAFLARRRAAGISFW